MTFMPSTVSTDPSSKKGRLAASSLLMCRVPLLMGCLSRDACILNSLSRFSHGGCNGAFANVMVA